VTTSNRALGASLLAGALLLGCPEGRDAPRPAAADAAPVAVASAEPTPSADTSAPAPPLTGPLKLFAPLVPITTDAAVPIPTERPPDPPGSRCGEARFVVVRPVVKVSGERTKRSEVVHPAVDVTAEGGRAERIYLPVCNAAWPACHDFGSCVALEKNDLAALEPPAQGAIAGLRCEGPQPMIFVLVKGRVGLDVLGARSKPSAKPAFAPIVTTSLQAKCARAGALTEATREIRVDP